jgi:murein L,D-transpeptidase YafK
MNPNSSFHLAFNLGYPNAYDRANKRTGEFLMIHGKCKSAGCYAMTDALIEEMYALAREAFISGQEEIHVHAFPFRMTAQNFERHKKSPHYRFWLTLKQGYDFFEASRQVPGVAVCERRYVVNVRYYGDRPIRPDGACPAFEREQPAPFVPLDGARTAEHTVVDGPRMRTAARSGSSGGSVLGGFSSALGFGSSAGNASMLGHSR